jgi:cytochrome b subunit of formate dehydrogenase
MWGVMIFPFMGILMMLAMMFFFFRWMKGGGQMSGMIGQHEAMSWMMGHGHGLQSKSNENAMNTVTYNIRSIKY